MAGKVSGPYDEYRDDKPADIDQAKWDAYIDQMNTNEGSVPWWALGGSGTDPTGMSPSQFQSKARGAIMKPSTPSSVQGAATVNRINDWTARTTADSNRLIGGYEGAINNANFVDQNALGSLTAAQDAARQGYYGVAGQQRDLANSTNAASAQMLGGLWNGYAGLNAQDQGALDRYIGETNPLMTQLTARGSNPADVQRQMDAYNMASGIAGGSLDYQAAQYASNPADVQRQMQAYNTLMGVGGGSLDYQAALAQAVLAQTERYESSARDIDRQETALRDIRNDLRNGSKDQREVMEKFKGLSDPTVTAKERFLSELARREFEAADRSSRGAVSQNLAMRGLRSGGQEIAMQQAERQQIAQDRLLKELGIQGQAVDRSMVALGGWGNTANAIRAGDQAALGMQAGMVNTMRGMNDQVGMFNTAEANTTNRYNAGLQTNTNQFNAAQKNQASANNQATRLSGYQGAAAQSNAIRNSNDQVGMFNTGQTNIARANNQATRMQGANLQANQSNAIRSANDSISMFQDQFAQNEATRVGNLAGQRNTATLNTTGQIGSRMSDFNNQSQSALDAAYGRSTGANQAQWDAIGKDVGMSSDYFNAVTGNADRSANRAGALAGTSINANQQTTDNLIRALGIQNNQWTLEQEKSLAGAGW